MRLPLLLCLVLVNVVPCARAQDAARSTLAQVDAAAALPGESSSSSGEVQPAVPLVSPDTPVSDNSRRWHWSLRLTIRGAYDDNINISNATTRQGDWYFSFEPVINIGIGDPSENSLNFTYAPNASIYLKRDYANSVQHILRLSGTHRFSRLSLTASEDVQILDGANLDTLNNTSRQANIDVGQRTRVNNYNTNVGASYDLTGKTSLSAAGNYSVSDYATLLSSSTVSGNLFVNYTPGGKLTLGLGGTGGYNTADGSSNDQTFTQVNARLNYQATGKITLSASGGVEFRQFSGNTRGSYETPVFELAASYQPFDGTSISLSGNRRIQNSAILSNQDFTSTDLSVSFQQRFLQRIYFNLAVGYENADYFSTIVNASGTRTDNFYYIEPGLDFTVTRWLSVGGFFLHRENASTFSAFSFDDNQVGFRTSLSF